VDTGKAARLKILSDNAAREIIAPLEKHNWECKILGSYEVGEYLIIQIDKGSTQFKLGYMYSCATDNSVYKRLDNAVDLIILNGSFYHLESFARGISTEVIELKSLQKQVVKWNSEASNGKISYGGQDKPKIKPVEFTGHIQSEQPIHQIWSRIRQFKTKGLAEKLVIQRCSNSCVQLDEATIKAKASGLAFCVQNGCDYFETASKQKLNQRIVSLYYGAIAFASAEMLASPNGPTSLQKVENMTKFGHGLYTFDALVDNDFEGLIVGVQSNGFFSKWVEFLGCDVSDFPPKRPRKQKDIELSSNHVTTLVELFSHIPELEDLFRMVSNTPTNWLSFHFDSEANGGFRAERTRNTYVKITDISCTKTIEDIANINLPIEQIEYTTSKYPGLHFKALIEHPEHEYWHGAIKQHRSPFAASSYVLPIFGSVSEYRCIATVILYALSILVRYRPSIWREVVSGKYENYLALTDEFLSIYERLAPELFLESLLDTNVRAVQSGSMNAHM